MIRYVTRWALTTGIRMVDGQYTADNKYFSKYGMFVTSGEAFETEEEAIEQAKKMAKHKVELLKKQIKVFENNWQPKIQRLVEKKE
jgi:hypothetical protein